ncbi:carboxyphosphonoenolpyruvate mutase, putative [Ricinus communis]|uniref:Carboxyphosphonoenolpyruvate mutase, putative n=1 Tax=Ricinus communis TaxID=3988 RepID=B9T359_RICCO|nr:carboxyphosphonoenolpyruvate mutase, putative [Ricinus communis]
MKSQAIGLSRDSCSLVFSPSSSSSSSSLCTSNFKSQRSLLIPNNSISFQRKSDTFILSSSFSTPKRVSHITCSADTNKTSPAKALRLILELPGIHQGPACFDALSARLVEKAGFDYCFTSGFSISAARLALPDTGFISYGEMVDQGRLITEAVSIPIIGDGDNGYGNAMNVKRTVKGYIKAGFAGIILEDQVSPKACGHTRGRKVVSREEAVMRIKAAVDAREETGSDIVIVARTDSRQAISLDESLWRSRAFADAGADVLFIDALASREEMKAFCEISLLVPKMDSLKAIKGGRIPPPGSMPSFEEIKEILGFNDYYEEENQYAISTRQTLRPAARSNVYDIQQRTPDDTAQRIQSPQDPVVEVITPDVISNYGADGSRDPFSGIWSRKLRVKITGRDGFEKLDVRIPAGFLEGITDIVPALGGVNIKELLKDAAEEVGGKLLLDFNDTIGDRIQVFLE